MSTTKMTLGRRGRLASSVMAGMVLLGASLVGGAAPAQAPARDGVCDDGEYCYYYLTGLQGAVADLPPRDGGLRRLAALLLRVRVTDG